MSLTGCPSCQGFNPPSISACLHCGHALEARSPSKPRRGGGFWMLAGAGVAAITLMACYGAPPCDDCEPEPTDAGMNDAGQ